MPAPVLTYINPETVVKGVEFTLEAYGDPPNYFDNTSVIEIDGYDQPTTFIQFDSHLEALVGYSITGTATNKVVKVKNGTTYAAATKTLYVVQPSPMKPE